MASNRTAFALGRNGGLYVLIADEQRWVCIVDVGTRHNAIAVDFGYLYGVNYALAVDVQRLKGADASRWSPLAQGPIISVAVWAGAVYGAGNAPGGDKVYQRAMDGGDQWGWPWAACPTGKCRALATDGSTLYVLGNNDTVYRQPLRGLSMKAKWQGAFPAGGCQNGFASLEDGACMGICEEKILLREPRGGAWALSPQSGLTCPIVAVTSAAGSAKEFLAEILAAPKPKPVAVPIANGEPKGAVTVAMKDEDACDNGMKPAATELNGDSEQTDERGTACVLPAKEQTDENQTFSLQTLDQALPSCDDSGAACGQAVASDTPAIVVGSTRCCVSASTLPADWKWDPASFLTLAVGEPVLILAVQDDGWLYGEHDSRKGWLPASALQSAPNSNDASTKVLRTGGDAAKGWRSVTFDLTLDHGLVVTPKLPPAPEVQPRRSSMREASSATSAHLSTSHC